MQNISRIELKDITLTCHPTIMYQKSKQDILKSFSHTFTSGNVYSIISEPGTGGWALSYLLSGRVKAYAGVILIDGELINRRVLQSKGWYIGEEVPNKNKFGFHKEQTIQKQVVTMVSGSFNVSVIF